MSTKPSIQSSFKTWLREEKYRVAIQRECGQNTPRASALIAQLEAGRPRIQATPETLQKIVQAGVWADPKPKPTKSFVRDVLESVVVAVALAIDPIKVESQFAAQ